MLHKLTAVGCLVATLLLVGCGSKNAAAIKRLGLPDLPARVGLIDELAPSEFTATDSGLKYRILRDGTGIKPTATQKVLVQYHGWLNNQTVFDSSYRKGSVSFLLMGVIPGWTEGLQLIGKGGMIELEIPGSLGYGEAGSPPDIPPNATLHFIVELQDVR